jgi:glycosylphosphatidylinositol transamidase (GPIT) subunit GPI8
MIQLVVLLSLWLSSVADGKKTFALIVSSSRYWSNYRDRTNIAFFYNTVKSMGIPDSNIISMFSDEIICHPRNPFPGLLYDSSPRLSPPVAPGRISVTGNEVSRDNFFRILHEKQPKHTPRYRRMHVDQDTNLFVYFTGHSAVGYTKFQDFEDVDANDIGYAIEHLWQSNSYSQLLWIGDTCRAASIHNAFFSPKITAIGSSNEVDKSYSMPTVTEIGESVVDRFTYITKEEFVDLKHNLTIDRYLSRMDPVWMGSQVTHRTTESGVGLDGKLIDFLSQSLSVTKIFENLQTWASPIFTPSKDSSIESMLTRGQLRENGYFHVSRDQKKLLWSPLWVVPLGLIGFLLAI